MSYLWKPVKRATTVALLLGTAVLLSGCITGSNWSPAFSGPYRKASAAGAAGSGSGSGGSEGPALNVSYSSAEAVQQRIAEAAYGLVGRSRLVVNGERFPADCTGTILAAYYAAGIDLRPYFRHFTGNGVTRLYKIGESYDLASSAEAPQPGDVVFWDNTYDRNRDGRFNDQLTHAGVVVKVQSDGQLEYVHYNYSRGVVVERLNLSRPDTHMNGDTLVNSPMRMKRDRHIRPHSWLASHLFRSFSALYRL